MRIRELNQQLRMIEEAITFGESLGIGMPERAIIARYVCVLVSGYIENIVRVTLTEFAVTARPKVEIVKYVEASVDRFQNPDFKKIVELSAKFEPRWREKLEALDGSISDAINSVVSNRHLIAHGKTSGMSLAQITAYFALAKEFAREFKKIVR